MSISKILAIIIGGLHKVAEGLLQESRWEYYSA